MIRTILKIKILIIFVGISFFANAQTVAYVNMEQLKQELIKKEGLDTILANYKSLLEHELGKAQQKMQDYYQKMMPTDCCFCPTREDVAQLQKMQEDLEKQIAEFDKRFSEKELEIKDWINIKIKGAIEIVALANQYQIVLDKKNVWSATENELKDITPKLRLQLGLP